MRFNSLTGLVEDMWNNQKEYTLTETKQISLLPSKKFRINGRSFKRISTFFVKSPLIFQPPKKNKPSKNLSFPLLKTCCSREAEPFCCQNSTLSLQKIIDFMKKYPYLLVVLEGHTDIDGPQASNYSLSQRRVTVIQEYLLSAGLSKEPHPHQSIWRKQTSLSRTRR